MSKDIKKEFLPFGFSELDAVSRRFEERAAEGWMLKTLDTTCIYERTLPRALRFNVVLCPTAEAGSNNISEKSHEFIRLCEDAGWSFVDHRGAAYAFFTDSEGAPEIETDDLERVNAVRKAGMQNRTLMTLPLALNGFNALVQLFAVIDTRGNVLRIALFAFLLLALLISLAGILADRKRENEWCERALESISTGEPIPRSGEEDLKARRRIAVLGISSVIFLTLALIAVMWIKGDAPIRASLIAAVLTAIPVALLAPGLARKERSKGKTALTVLLVLGAVILFVVLFAIFGSVLHAFEEILA